MTSILQLGLRKVKKVGSITSKKHQHDSDINSEPTSLDDLLRRIKKKAIPEIQIGFQDSNFITCRSHALLFDNALKISDRCITSISIGRKIHDIEVLGMLFSSIARYCRLEHFKCSLFDSWVPEYSVRQVLQMQSTTLTTIDIRSVMVKRRNHVTGRYCCTDSNCRKYHHPTNKPNTIENNHHNNPIKYNRSSDTDRFSVASTNVTSATGNNSSSIISSDRSVGNAFLRNCLKLSSPTHNCDHNFVSRIMVPSLQQNNLQNVTKLYLSDCNIEDKQLHQLAEVLQTRYYIHGRTIDELSLRMNRKLGPKGLRAICQAPITKVLDLSLCDLKAVHGIAVAKGIASRLWPLENLVLCANYQIGTLALLKLLEPRVCSKIYGLNISYCDLDSGTTCMVLNGLNLLQSSNTTLREVHLHGAKVHKAIVSNAVCTLLRNNLGPKLRILNLNDPNDRSEIMTANQLRTIRDNIRNNFYIEQLGINYIQSLTEERAVWKEISYYLQLNQAGRRLFVNQPPYPIPEHPLVVATSTVPTKSDNREEEMDDWFQLLENAGSNDNLDVLYWMVRHSSDRFGSYRR